MDRHQALNVAAAWAGGKGKLAQRLGISRQAIATWTARGVPLVRGFQIERMTDGLVKMEQLCPEHRDDKSHGTV